MLGIKDINIVKAWGTFQKKAIELRFFENLLG